MPDAPDDPTESEIAGAANKLETMVSSIGEYFLPAGQTWRAAGVVAAGEIDYLVNFHPRQICQVVCGLLQQNCGYEAD